MARPSKLTEKQWAEIGRRLLEGEQAASLAREFGVGKAAISMRFSKRIETVKTVAGQIVQTEKALSLLNLTEQSQAFSLAGALMDVSKHLAGAARYGSMTAHRLSGIAHGQVDRVDDADPLAGEGEVTLKGISALTRIANTASEIGLNLLRANKEAIDGLNNSADKPEPKQIVFTVVDASA